MKTRMLALGLDFLTLGRDTSLAKFYSCRVLPGGAILQYVKPRRETCILGRGCRLCTDERLRSPNS